MAMKPTPATAATTPVATTTTPAFSLKPSKQTAAILGGLIAVCLVGAGGYFALQQSEVSALETQIRSKNQQVNDSEQVAKKLQATEDQYQIIRGRIGKLETSVSETDYVPTLLKQIERLAKDNGLRVDSQTQSFEPAPEPPADVEARKKFVPQPYDVEKISLRVQGRYWNVARFLYRLTEFPKILSTERVDFSPGQTDPGKSPILSVNLDLKGYLFKPDKDMPAPEPSPIGGVTLPNIPTAAPTLPPRPEVGVP